MTERTALYRHFDAAGRLLYVGISRSVAARLAQHATSGWDDQIASVTVERFPTRHEAEAAERRAILTERPAHNRTFRCGLDEPLPQLPGEWRLQDFLDQVGATQEAFAELIGTTAATVSRWCTGKAFPKPDAICRINAVTNGNVPPGVWFNPPAPRDGEAA